MKFFIILGLFVQGLAYSQTSASQPDELYQAFVQAYADLNVDNITRLYAENATIINLYDDQLPASISGQKAIRDFYQQYFKSVANNQQKMKLTFKVVQRDTQTNTINDCGYFLLEISKVGQPTTTLYGRFCTQLQYVNHRWQFSTDAATHATITEYETATAFNK